MLKNTYFVFFFLTPLCAATITSLLQQFESIRPQEWTETVSGVKTRIKTTKKEIALTLDCCGGKTDGCDYRYITFFEQEQIPVTLFITSLWIERHPQDFAYINNHPLFAIDNHGTHHMPASVNGKSAYGIKGTQNIQELINEVETNAQLITQLTQRKPRYFRAGTAFYDEVAVQVINKLGYEVIGFSIVGDGGATWPAERVKNALLAAQAGDIIILHMNRPEKDAALGALEALKQLKAQGFTFVKLDDYELE